MRHIGLCGMEISLSPSPPCALVCALIISSLFLTSSFLSSSLSFGLSFFLSLFSLDRFTPAVKLAGHLHVVKVKSFTLTLSLSLSLSECVYAIDSCRLHNECQVKLNVTEQISHSESLMYVTHLSLCHCKLLLLIGPPKLFPSLYLATSKAYFGWKVLPCGI